MTPDVDNGSNLFFICNWLKNVHQRRRATEQIPEGKDIIILGLSACAELKLTCLALHMALQNSNLDFRLYDLTVLCACHRVKSKATEAFLHPSTESDQHLVDSVGHNWTYLTGLNFR